MNKDQLIDWGFRWVAAGIFTQSLFYKLSAHPDSVLLFSSLGLEPAGRIGVGGLELTAAILLIVPETLKFGIILGLGIMAAVIGVHLFALGIKFNEDGGRLFFLALVTSGSLLVLAYRHRTEIKNLLSGSASA